MDSVLLLAIQGLFAIASLVLITLGLGVIYGMMRVINLAHGEFMMLGAYTAVISRTGWREHLDRHAGLAAASWSALVGLILERTLIRFLYGRMIDTMLATWGVSLGLIGLITTHLRQRRAWRFDPDGRLRHRPLRREPL